MCLSFSPDIARRTVTVFGLSKTFGLAGLRIGSLVTPSTAAYERLVELSQVRTAAAGVTTVSQVAAVAAYDKCWYWAGAFPARLRRMRDYAVSRLNAIRGVSCHSPEGTYALFRDITGLGRGSGETAGYLLEKARASP